MGNEILLAILLSVILQFSKISFQLQLENFYLLDYSWCIPEMAKLELVPCKNLGLSISFSENKAIIVHISPHSVAAESGDISVGDVLANLNGVEINSSCKGSLNTILRNNKGRPVTLVIVKALNKASGDLFYPLRKLLQNVKIDLGKIKKPAANCEKVISISKNMRSGYEARFLDAVAVGNKGNVKQIQETLKGYVAKQQSKVQKLVNLEIGEMCVKIFDLGTNEIVLKHSYMQISSCGSLPNLPHHLAYIAGNENCETASKFTCYIFYMDNREDAITVLQSIGQGFYRTNFAV